MLDGTGPLGDPKRDVNVYSRQLQCLSNRKREKEQKQKKKKKAARFITDKKAALALGNAIYTRAAQAGIYGLFQGVYGSLMA